MKTWKHAFLIRTAILLGCSGGEPPTPFEDDGTIVGCSHAFVANPTSNPDIELVALRLGDIACRLPKGSRPR